jgi:hypothetical protein
MSLSKLEEIVCPCGETFEAELWNSINPDEDTELKEALLSGEINIVCCPGCGQIFHAEHFVLYHDAVNEILVFVYPKSFDQQATLCAEKMNADFKRAMGGLGPEKKIIYQPILLFGLDSLVDLIRVEEAEKDDTSILEYLAGELGLSLLYLMPSAARERQLLRVLPCVPRSDGTRREQIIEGIRTLLSHNENLSFYRKLLDNIEQNESWALDKSIVLREKIHRK